MFRFVMLQSNVYLKRLQIALPKFRCSPWVILEHAAQSTELNAKFYRLDKGELCHRVYIWGSLESKFN